MGLRENARTEPVSRLNLRKPALCAKTCTIREAIQKMRHSELGCVIAVDEARKPIGILTEAMLRNMLSKSPGLPRELVSDRMATLFPWVRLTDPIETVLEAMEVKNHRFVVVVDEENQVVGLTGQKGLMEYVAEHFPQEVMVQRLGTKEFPDQREGA
jgi:CBS domain-containing protein